jgi:hypothetical protein
MIFIVPHSMNKGDCLGGGTCARMDWLMSWLRERAWLHERVMAADKVRRRE